jgi:hypothetical protein
MRKLAATPTATVKITHAGYQPTVGLDSWQQPRRW